MKCGTCGFENPSGFDNTEGLTLCAQCGKPLRMPESLTPSDLEHLRTYLPSSLAEELQFELLAPPPRLLDACVGHLGRLLDITRSHLPANLVERIERHPVPGQAGGEFVYGTLSFADISGFTNMSERLSRIGREGAEEITSIINRYFGVMLAVLRDHGGQLIKFGGDALLGLFVEPDSAARAVQAALAMQAAMAEFAEIKTSLGVFPLRMKVAVHRGRFFAAQLGTAQGMEYHLFGADVNATAATESAATAGQVLLDRPSHVALGMPCRASPHGAPPHGGLYLSVEHIEPFRSAGSFVSAPISLEPTLAGARRAVEQLDALSPYLPAGLLSRIASDPSATLLEGEHRLVSILFANVHGLGEVANRLGPGREADIVAALNHYFVAMGNAIHRFGGVINKMDLYDHGDKLLAFFGAPVAHEDDAERAVRAAKRMQSAMAEVGCTLPRLAGLPDLCLRQEIGLSYGNVFAGYVGSRWRHEYTVMGDDVNVCARLMSVAQPGEAIIGPSVRRKVQALFDLESRGEVTLKGKSQPMPAFAVMGERARPEPLRGLRGMTSPLVGRQAEWDQLRAALDLMLAGRGQIALVLGEAGLGKSRLVAEMRQNMRATTTHSAASGLYWFEGRCLSYTESVSFLPFQQLVRQMAGIRQDDNEIEAWSKLRSLVDRRLPPDQAGEQLPYLATFLNLSLEPELQERVRYLDAEALQRRMFVALSTLIEAQARFAPLVLTLEDIHWIDQASYKLLEFLLPLVNRVPLAWLLLYRPERGKDGAPQPTTQLHERITREFAACAAEIVLQPLDARQSQELLNHLVRAAQWPPEVQSLILNRTEGNPLYVEEVLRSLIEDRTLIQDERGQWQLSGALNPEHIPDTLQGVMMTRLDRLEELYRRTAQVASVVGRIFVFDVLSHIEDQPAHLGDSLVNLQYHEIVRETQRVPELTYAFIHTMMQEVCYQSLLARVRRLYHCKIAEYLEAGLSEVESQSEAESRYPLIAHHAFAGQDWGRGLRYQLVAGQQAKRLFANQAAVDHLERAMQCADNLPPADTVAQRQSAHSALGELLVVTNQYDHAREHLQAALDLASERRDADAQAHACRWQARLYELRGEYPEAFGWIEKGLSTLQGRETIDAAEMLVDAGFIHTRQGHYDSALGQCRKGLQIAQALGEKTVLARAYNLLGHISYLQGHHARAIEHCQHAFDLYESAGDINGQALTHNNIANACFHLGQWHEAERHYGLAREMFEKMGSVYYCAMADNNLGGIATNQGRLDEAVAYYQSALNSMERIGGSLWVLGGLYSNLGAVYVRRGEWEAARQHLRTSQQYFERGQARDWLPELYRRMAEADLGAGDLAAADLAAAEAHGQQAFQLARELAMRGEEGCALHVLGDVSAAQGRWVEAEQRLGESLAILAEVGEEYEGARAALSLAQVYAAQGKTLEMRQMLEKCAPVFERLDAALDLAAARSLS